VEISPDPLGIRPPHLETFLAYPGDPLSSRATGGFFARANSAKLNFAHGFLDAVERHLESVCNQNRLFEPAPQRA
jgi:DNA (cytosine-5)-methyltransferase 1